ncbi:MAG: hypothetical protein RIA69_19630 [Cyclobacteriaceae bacterium]
MKNKKIVKKILHYLGEIIVVTIGIFIAFQLNNYAEAQKMKNREESSLKRIVSDLESEKNWLKTNQKHFTRSKQKLERILFENDRQNLDSLYYFLAREYVHFNYNVEYSTLKFSGNLFMISNDSIRSSLVKYYEFNYTYSEEIAQRHKSFVENYLLEYLSDSFSLNQAFLYDGVEVEGKLEDQEFIEKIETQVMWYGTVLTTIKLDYVNHLIDAINKEIGKNANKK